MLRKHLAIAAAVLALASGPIRVPAQGQPHAGSGRAVFSVDATAERIPNLDTLITELKQYHDCTCKCGCYARDLDLQADRALSFLRRRAAHRAAQEKLAVVFDIDETSLSNYQEMLRVGFVFDARAFDAWVDTAAAPAIPGSLRIDKEAQRLGVQVFFITAYKSAARAQVAAQGYKIVLNAGDQWSDLKDAPQAEFSVKYPNPYYLIP